MIEPQSLRVRSTAVIRREEILDASEKCFARAGFHQTSVQEVCAELGMSPGNLYRYFRSKEEIIASIVERNLLAASEQFRQVRDAPDFFSALTLLARHYLIEKKTESQIALWAEIMAEARRNPNMGRLYEEIARHVKAHFAAALRTAAEQGKISSKLDIDGAVNMLLALGDGLCWRRAVDPEFSVEAILPLVVEMIRRLLMEADEADTGGRT